MKRQKTFLYLIIVVLILSLFVIPLTLSQNTPPMPPSPAATPVGTPSPTLGGEVDSSTGLPKDVLPVKNIGDTISDEDKRTAYLKAEWEKILLKSETFGPWVKFLLKLDPVSNFLLGMPITFSWFFFLTLVIWISLLIIDYNLTKEIHIGLTIILAVLITYFRYSRDVAGFIIGVVALMNVWWMQYVIIGIIIFSIIIATYFSKQVSLIWKKIKENHEKNMEGYQKEEFKNDVEALKKLKKNIVK